MFAALGRVTLTAVCQRARSDVSILESDCQSEFKAVPMSEACTVVLLLLVVECSGCDDSHMLVAKRLSEVIVTWLCRQFNAGA